MKKNKKYIEGYCPRCSGGKSGKNCHVRYLLKTTMFGFIPACRCTKCGYVFSIKDEKEK